MSMKRTALVLSLVLAVTSPSWAQDAVQDAADRFVAGAGFAPRALDPIEAALADLIGPPPDPMLSAGADISPIEKAFLLIDTQEVPLPRSRYLLRYNRQTIEGVAVSFIDIERYNLGPAVREETIAEYGADNTAGPEAFGVGPHIAWRFVLQPSAKSAAVLLAASRRDIAEDEAVARDCLPRTCLSLELLAGAADWSAGAPREAPLKSVAYPALAPSQFDPDAMEIVPAYQALELAVAAGLAQVSDAGVTWSIPDRQGGDSAAPFLVVLVDHNLGQEIFSDAALGLAKLGLDSQEHWTRIGTTYFDGGLAQTLSHADGPLAAGN